jgi:hypothetical protein
MGRKNVLVFFQTCVNMLFFKRFALPLSNDCCLHPHSWYFSPSSAIINKSVANAYFQVQSEKTSFCWPQVGQSIINSRNLKKLCLNFRPTEGVRIDTSLILQSNQSLTKRYLFAVVLLILNQRQRSCSSWIRCRRLHLEWKPLLILNQSPSQKDIYSLSSSSSLGLASIAMFCFLSSCLSFLIMFKH